MACDAVMDILHRETSRFVVPIMQRRVFPRSLWLNIVRRGEWMAGMGTTINTLNFERSAPTDAEPTWSSISVSDGQEGGSCLPPAHKISVSSRTQSFNLSRRVLEGPDICNIDIMPSFDLQNQLGSVAGILGDYAKIEWEIRYRHEFFRLVDTKVVVDDCTSPTESTSQASTYPSACPTQPMHMAILRTYAIQLMRDGAGAESLLRANGAPLLTVIASNETIGNIIRQDGDLREDIRHSNMNNILVTGFGISHSYGNLVFLADPFPRRFSCTDGTFTEIPAFSLTATLASKGQRAIVNSSWRTAANEETFIFDPGVFSALIPRPPVAPHPNFRFDPVSYVGDVSLRNIPDRVCNPDGNIVYHRMHLMAASMPGETWKGVAFAHVRCDPEGCTLSCVS